jgi:hypothetical protein
MSETKSNSPTLADVMILVAATALGLAITRVHGWLTLNMFLDPSAPSFRRWALAFEIMTSYYLPLPLAWTIVLAFLPARDWGRLSHRGPGRAVSYTSVFVFACLGSTTMRNYLDLYNPYMFEHGYSYMRYFSLGVFTEFGKWNGLVVAAVWLALAINGQWNVKQDWVERAGRLAGGLWIAVSILSLFFVSLCRLVG